MENFIINTYGKENNNMESIYTPTYAAMFGEKFAEELAILCKKHGTNLETFHWKVIDTYEIENLKEDIRTYIEEQTYIYTIEDELVYPYTIEDGFVDAVINAYNDIFDADMGTWDNIRSAIEAVAVDEGVPEKYRKMADKVLGREEE